MNHRIKPNNYPRIGYNGIFIFFLNLFGRVTLSTMHIETIDAKKHISTMATMDIIVTSIHAKNNGFMVFLIDDINKSIKITNATIDMQKKNVNNIWIIDYFFMEFYNIMNHMANLEYLN